MEIKEWIEIGFVALATIVYLIVTLVQKAQIDKIKSVNDSLNSLNSAMSNYASIFDANKVKEYVKLNEDRVGMKAANMILDEKWTKEFLSSEMSKQIERLQEFYFEEKGQEFLEMLNMIANIIHQNKDNKENLELVLNKLPRTKYLFDDIINDNSPQNNKVHEYDDI